MVSYNPEDYYIDNEDDVFLTKCVINVCASKITIEASDDTTREIQCDNADEFTKVLDLIRHVVSEEDIEYAAPVFTSN